MSDLRPTTYQFLQYLFIFAIGIGMTACVKEEVVSEQRAIVVDSELQPFFTLFEEEGKVRGRDINIAQANIIGILTDISAEAVVGQCVTNANSDQKTIRIDQTYWSTATAMEREFLIFHELGHCYLGRTHLDTSNSNGKCSSLMNSGIGGCRFSYNSANRTAYLDELFE